ncbi:polysaccharide pyruvyl transferase CsaB [Ornithinibacillus sp. 179-J 7C1 HS]|uniref:polysaccharide pyruvyl transferase CsaB n=1 Tax=Ornithinibacillus sp. 179-J 7C1 HS TaxID=3142384 RepID=UPI0039A0646C
MHIVLSGYYGYGNVGDEAILLSIIEAMRKQEPDIQFTVLSFNPEETSITYGVHAINRFDFTSIYQAIKESDGLISGGGSLIQDETGLRSVPYYTGIIQIARWHKKPVFIYAQGMGPIKLLHNKLLVRWTFNKVDFITVRDELSKKFLEKIGIKKQVYVVPDPVLGLDYTRFTTSWPENNGVTDKYIAVSVRDWPTKFQFKMKIAKALDSIAEMNYKIIFVPMHGEHDELTSAEIMSIMEKGAFIAPHQLTTEEKIALIGKSELLIGVRLHSLIFAALNQTPFVAISYDPKIDAFASIFNQPIIGHVANDDWDDRTLFNQVASLLKNPDDFKESLQDNYEKHRITALRTAELAINIFTEK